MSMVGVLTSAPLRKKPLNTDHPFALVDIRSACELAVEPFPQMLLVTQVSDRPLDPMSAHRALIKVSGKHGRDSTE